MVTINVGVHNISGILDLNKLVIKNHFTVIFILENIAKNLYFTWKSSYLIRHIIMYASTHGIHIFILETNSKANNMIILTFYHYLFPFFF
jgi:hypothetical protein